MPIYFVIGGMKVLVYRSRRGDPQPLFNTLQDYFGEGKVAYIDAAGINQGELVNREIKMLVIPGGESALFAEELKGSANRNIEKYVSLGGRLMGICAGSYYLADEFEYKGNRVKNELGLVNVFAKGVIKRFEKEGNIWSAVAQVIKAHNHEVIPSVYIAGPCFYPKGNARDIKVLANYAEMEDNAAAVIQTCHGDGQIMLIGPHLEMDEAYLRSQERSLGERCVHPQFKHNLQELLASQHCPRLSKAFFFELLETFTGVAPKIKKLPQPEI